MAPVSADRLALGGNTAEHEGAERATGWPLFVGLPTHPGIRYRPSHIRLARHLGSGHWFRGKFRGSGITNLGTISLSPW